MRRGAAETETGQGSVRNARTGQRLNERMTKRVIGMGMAREQNFDVGELKAKRLDICTDDGNGPFEAGIDQNVAVGSGDQIARKPFGADVVEMIGNAMRRKWVIPIALGEKRGTSHGHPEEH